MKTLPTLIFFLFVFLLAFNDVSLAAPRVPSAPDPITYAPYSYSEWDYQNTVNNENYRVRVFAPRSNGLMLPNRPLAVILHGNGYDSLASLNNYRELSIHLARNGFFVIVPDWDSGEYARASWNKEQFESAKHAIVENIQRVYQDYDWHLSDDVVLIGHSVGGAGVIRYANEVQGASPPGRNLKVKSIVSMAASPKELDMTQRFNLHDVTKSALVMIATGDEEQWGEKQNGVMRTGIKLYDSIGTQSTIYYPRAGSYPTKDLLVFHRNPSNYLRRFEHAFFAKDLVDPMFGMKGYIKDVKGYINAYLRLHVYGDQRYNRYFKHQKKPASLSNELIITQAHAAQEKKVLANFTRRSKTRFYGGGSSAVGSITVNPNSGEINTYAVRSWQEDDFSPHKDNVLNVSWDRQGARGSSRLSFNYYVNNRPDIRRYNYLSFRVTQRSSGVDGYDYYNPMGNDLDFRVRLFTTNHGYSKAIYVGQNAEKIPYPHRFKVKEKAGSHVDVTKHTMQTVLIPLSAFEKDNGDELDLSSIRTLKFYFYGKGRITIDNIEFIK